MKFWFLSNMTIKKASSPAVNLPLVDISSRRLKRELKAALFRKRLTAIGLVAPLAIFLLITFVVPIAMLLKRAVDNPEVVSSLPRTVAALARWDGKNSPDGAAYAALATDLANTEAKDRTGILARRINLDMPGAGSVVIRTARKMSSSAVTGKVMSAAEIKDAFIKFNPRWGRPDYWQIIASNGSRYTPHYLLAALDMYQDPQGRIHHLDTSESAYVKIFARTFSIGLGVTFFCLIIGYPLAYWLSTMPERRANLFMILVLLPFWTSILVRISAWIVLLQSDGLVNKTLIALGLTQAPLELLFNRISVYLSMTHILLPFMILSLYSVMKSIQPSYMRAAISLGSHPVAAFGRIYLPLTFTGIRAGSLLVFISALGYYITPALLGGSDDQMVSYYIAYFTNTALNWGMACALSALLLAAVTLLYGVYQLFTKSDENMRLS